jgi:hypothetical protein
MNQSPNPHPNLDIAQENNPGWNYRSSGCLLQRSRFRFLASCSALVAILCGPPRGNTAQARTLGWSSVELLSNEVVSARLVFKQSPSLTDTNWLVLELENHNRQPLELDQVYFQLSTTQKDLASGKTLFTGGLSPALRSFTRTLKPGLNPFYADAQVGTGLPPANGLRIEAAVYGQVWVRGRRRYDVPRDKAFVFDWRYPSPEEITAMGRELKQLLGHHSDLDENFFRIAELLPVSQARDSLTLDDYLPALKATKDWNLRWRLLPHLFAEYSNAPPVLAYYRDAFQKNPQEVDSDASNPAVWNEEFLEPLVRGCEQDKWHYFTSLERHPDAWKNRPEVVARVSAALLKHNPTLKREVGQVPEAELENWAKAVAQAGEVGDLGLIELLKPALEDRRDARIDRGSGGVDEGRVCDRALHAILKLLDGDSWTAFKKAGVTNLSNEADRLKGCDRMIEVLKARLNSLRGKS